MKGTVLIAGCGYVGGALAHRLAAGGTAVWALRRSPGPPQPGIEPVAADLTDRAGLQQALASLPPLDAVVYTAAAGGRTDAAYQAAYVTGVAHLLEALEALGQKPGAFLFTSSTGVYGQGDGEWVDETSPTEPPHFTGRRLLEGEALLRRADLPTTAVRFGGIYGPGRTRLIDQVRRGEARLPAVLPGEAPLYTNRIHREDCAGVLHHLLEMEPGERHDLYLGVDDDPAPLAEVYRWLARHLGVAEPPEGDSLGGDRRGRSNKRCSNRRLRESGYTFRYPSFREGYGRGMGDFELSAGDDDRL
jgi:nucleoside-diphosphate-sugar epimerase